MSNKSEKPIAIQKILNTDDRIDMIARSYSRKRGKWIVVLKDGYEWVIWGERNDNMGFSSASEIAYFLKSKNGNAFVQKKTNN